jgi:lipoprotein-anchoring transpeptidase ErfK/SrfK
MITRRSLIASGAATGLVAAAPALAATRKSSESWTDIEPKVVWLKTRLEPGEIHVDPNTFSLYWTLSQNQALRYRIGVAKTGLYEPGTFTVGKKREWPSWTPTAAMIRRNPGYAKFAGGMKGGPTNPLGARALYLFNENGWDTMLRIHGTNLPKTIGHRVSNGCARLVNEQVIELYNKVPVGTKVILHHRTG